MNEPPDLQFVLGSLLMVALILVMDSIVVVANSTRKPAMNKSEMDRRVEAYVRQRQIDREVTRKMKHRHFKRVVVPVIVTWAGSLVVLSVFLWSIFG